MKKLILQAIHLLRQNPFYSLVAIIGTAVTIAFVMVVVMIYEFRTADIAPEADRSRLMYTGTSTTQKADGTDIMRGMGHTAFEALFVGLPDTEDATWYSAIEQAVVSLPASSERYNFRVKNVAPNWFTFFEYDFKAGRPFNQAEYDLGRSAFQASDSEFKSTEVAEGSGYRHIVVSELVARRFFGSAQEALGKELLVNFSSSKVVGVVADVSAIFQTAYADIFQPFTLANEGGNYRERVTGGLGGIRQGVVKLSANASAEDIRKEVERREQLLNGQNTEYQFKLHNLYDHTEYTFFRESSVDARLVYVLLVLVLLGVPAISISGLMNAQMQSRLSEIAIRKAYGASNVSIIGHFFTEGLVNTLIGGVLGFLLSYGLVWVGRVWLFGSGSTNLSGISMNTELLLRPGLFIIVLLVCLVFNLLAVLLPATLAVRRNIVVTLKGGE